MNVFTPRQGWMYLAVLLAFLIPYTLGWAWGWWKFAGSSIFIVLLWRWAKPKDFARDLGIRVRQADLALAVLSLLVVGMIARHLIPGVVGRHGYVTGHPDPFWSADCKTTGSFSIASNSRAAAARFSDHLMEQPKVLVFSTGTGFRASRASRAFWASCLVAAAMFSESSIRPTYRSLRA
jgi:hypothetical protein